MRDVMHFHVYRFLKLIMLKYTYVYMCTACYNNIFRELVVLRRGRRAPI